MPKILLNACGCIAKFLTEIPKKRLNTPTNHQVAIIKTTSFNLNQNFF